jgi:hypothetical protein
MNSVLEWKLSVQHLMQAIEKPCSKCEQCLKVSLNIDDIDILLVKE